MCEFCETKFKDVGKAPVLKTPSNGCPYNSLEMIVMDLPKTVLLVYGEDSRKPEVIPFKYCPFCRRELNQEEQHG